MTREEVKKKIDETLKDYKQIEIICNKEIAYIINDKKKIMGCREFICIVRPWTIEQLTKYYEYHREERKFDSSGLGYYMYISVTQITTK